MPRSARNVRGTLSETRRTQILEAAARVFARRGFDRATIQDIARAAKLSEGSIYNYFRSKEELLVHIPQHLVRPLFIPLVEGDVPETLGEAEEILLGVCHGMVARVQEYAPFLKVFLSALPHLSPATREHYMQLLPTYAAERLERFLREGIRRGIFRADINVEIAARLLPGMLLLFLMTQEVLLVHPIVAQGYDRIIPEAVRLFLYGATPRVLTHRPAATP